MLKTYLSERELGTYNLFSRDYFLRKVEKSYYEKNQFYYLKKDLSHEIDMSAGDIEFSKCGSLMALGTDKQLYIYKIRNIDTSLVLQKMEIAEGYSQCFDFNNEATQIIYSFDSSIFINDIKTGKTIDELETGVYVNQISVSSLNIARFFCSNVLISYDLRTFMLDNVVIKNLNQDRICSIDHHPIDDNLLLISSFSSLLTLDLRNNNIVQKYYLPNYTKDYANSAMYNKTGTKILLSRPSFLPILFDVKKNYPEYEFNHYGFSQNFTYKVSCFAGLEDDYVVSTSDDFNILMWKIPEKQSDELITTRVNSANIHLTSSRFLGVKFNYKKSMLVSYGYSEKINFFSPFPLNNSCKKKTTLIDELKDEKFFTIYDNTTTYLKDFFKREKEIFDYQLEKILATETINMDYEFNQNSNICFLKTFIINYRTIEKKMHLDNLKILKQDDFLQNKNKVMSSLLIEVIKFFKTENFLMNSIFSLKSYLNLFIKAKENLFHSSNKKSSVRDIKRVRAYKKIILTIKCLIYDLIVIIKSNKELCKDSFEILENIARVYDGVNELLPLKTVVYDELNYLNDKITLVSSLNFSIEVEDNKELSLSKYYSEDKLKKLKHDLDFRKNINKIIKNFCFY